MSNKYSAYILFYSLGLGFWLLSMNMVDLTLVCVFYSVFIGSVWGLIPSISCSDALTWKHLFPPFMLALLMMFSIRLRTMMSPEVVLITAMALIHFRASIFTYARLQMKAPGFLWLQLSSFVFALVFLFQKNFLPFQISRSVFLMTIMSMSMLSLIVLLRLKRNMNGQAQNENDIQTIGS